ncbi:MAG: helix-turn-helix domain-containing protein [Thiotrichales bacterium]|nr:helix-turn-helix domain-containing protein [Thiotrichales bacterium]
MPTPHNPTATVRRALRKLGADIRDARRRRRLPMAVVAERAFTSRSTLQRVEAGDTRVSIGIYAGVLQALGLLDGLSRVADIVNDSVGQALASAELPRHVHLRRSVGSSRDG